MSVAAPPMREIFEDVREHQPPDPNEAARRGMRPRLQHRFYKEVTVSEGEGGFGLALDGRPVRTPAQRPLAVPTAPLAAVLAEEWRAQREFIDPSSLLLIRLATSIIAVLAYAAPARALEAGAS